MAMAGLRVLLVPLGEAGSGPGPGPPRDAVRVKLSWGQDALGSLLASGGLHLRGLAPGRAGRGHGSAGPGACADFVWEDTDREDGPPANKSKLLVRSENRALLVYEFSTEDGNSDTTALYSCKEDMLKKLLEIKNIYLSSISSLKILLFKNNTSLLLVNNFILVYLAFPGENSELEARDCITLKLPSQALERVADADLCRGILFLLDNSGWIYVFDTVDGALLANINVALYQRDAQDEKAEETTVSSLKSVKVSPDLSTAVIINSSHYAIAVDLNLYFRQFPGHLLCKRCFESLPVKQLEGIDEDELVSSDYSMQFVKFPFRTDRSWKAHLFSLYNMSKRPESPNFISNVNVPWYQYFPHLEHYGSKTYQTSEETLASIPEDIACALSKSTQKDYANNDTGRQWKKIHMEELEDIMKLECKSVTGFSALFALSESTKGLTVALWDLESQDVRHYHLGKDCVYVDCSGEEQLCLILTGHGLSLILFGLTQEEFLNRLIIYGSAGIVDSLCHLNGWGRCSIPIHALEAGLENRQLDTVDFFLKSKENIFSLSTTCSVAEQSTNITSQFYLRSVEELRPALDLLCSSVRENDMEAQSKHFSEQLLNLTLAFLNKQIREIFIHTEELDNCLQKCVDILTSYIIELRTFMIKFPRRQTNNISCDLGEDMPQIEQSPAWEKLTPEQVIAEAILNNLIPEAQTFFRVHHHPAQSLQELIRIGLDLVYSCLLKGNIKEASKLLMNMGFDVKEQLHKICLHTIDKNIRDLLVGVLQEENYFSEKEKKMIDFVHQVESFYSGSFQENRERHSLSSFRNWRKEEDLSSHTAVLSTFLNSDKHRINNKDHRVMLNWAQWWDPLTQEMILLPKKSPEDFKSCDPEVLWMHVTAQHDWLSICSWIEESLPHNRQTLCQQANWPPLTPDIIDQNTLCSSYVRNEILDKLARNGIFVPSEQDDFELLLLRLTHTGGIMQNPHPVPKYSTASGLDFHTCFILYCLEHSLQYLLYTYLDYYSLTPSNCPILDNKELHEAHPWFEFLVQCRGVASNPRDPKMIFQASLANAQILIPSNQASVSSMLLEGRTLLALATTMYAPGGIDQVLQNEDAEKPLKKVDPQLLKMALAPYPKLRAALFPQYTSHGILPSDISLYHLVQSLAPFDPTKLFGWQSTNTLAITDTSSDFPHFSSPELVNKYAIMERLDFSYYLHHGRPSFAFGTFLVQQLAKSKSPKQLIQQAGSEAYALALSFFYVPSIGAACVCFLELLGLDSLKLRVDIKVANLILSFKSKNEESQHSAIRESLVEKLTKLADGERTVGEEMLTCLEEAFWDTIEHQGIKKTSSDSRRQWSLVMQFCKLHNIRLSTSYLKECAKSNDWLQFIIQAQMYSYRPDEVICILQDFTPILQDHLMLAFESLELSHPSLGSHHSDSTRPVPTEQRQRGHPGDLFQILFWCQEKPNPSRYLLMEGMKHHAPFLSVLAACFQEAGIIQCLCVWIITSVDNATAAEATSHVQGSVENHEWDLQDLSSLWKMFLRKRKSKTLLSGFSLFLKDSPLLQMLEIYELCMGCKKYSEAKTKLCNLQMSLEKLKTSDEKTPSVIPLPWVESQASFLLELMLQQCRTQYELRKLLQLFADANNPLPDGPDVKKLCVLSQILKDSSIFINRAILTNYNTETFQNECRSILEQLQEGGMFSLARKVAELAELPVDSVVIQEVLRDLHLLKQTGQWHQKQTRIDFWKKCHDSFTKNSISNKAASDFFSAQANVVFESSADKINSNIEKHLLLTLAGHWLAQDDSVPLEKLEEMEKQIWLCRIAHQTLTRDSGLEKSRLSCQVSMGSELSFENLAKEFSFSKLATLNTPKYLQLDGLVFKDTPPHALDRTEVESLTFLIGHLLDEGSVHEASRVCHYFHFYNQDVSLVLHCRALAAGEADRNNLHPDIQALLVAEESSDEFEAPQPRRLQSTSSLENWSFVVVPSPDDQVILNLKTIIDECVHGRNYCRQVLCLYELSKELNCSYNELSGQDSEKVLRAILSSQQPDRCKKAQVFITTQGLPAETVAELVAEEITQELLASSEGKGQKQLLSPADESQAFLQLAKLCQDRTLVGMKLLDKVSSVPRGELSCTTELLILAHNCFSLTCHMEGITRVLQAARLLTDEHLAPNEEYSLVVRLLTGIGRYNEMTYIFDLLHEKHYFEVLMRKKLDPSGTLKTALLDYIKRCRPGDSEKHNMIALCFSMCREIGENHEAAACIQLKLIESQPWESLQDVPNLKKLLMKALTLFIDAAESYSKDSCVRQSLRCNRLTKLITLQLHFLNTNQSTMLINLNRQRLMDCIMSLPRFYQAAIVAEAYDFVPDWAEVLYQQVIIKGDFNYLEEFKQQRLLKANVFEEIAKKLKQHQPTEAALKNLKKLLTYCEDIYLYYRLAYDNKFYDVVNMLLKDAQTGCCLNDMLAN
ncbi:spatacsin isoform X2 [Alligator mississippiensis]|uniref:spatacsin isoform X2 n=1 Tax=Alligator mississippiensis TaxID=8496 RepID=UPI0028775317|nr:spatacsin isoform X2 [Alligator mississippiensis]